MDKKELLAIHGKAKVKNVAGILHNYTPNGTLYEAEQLENLILRYGDLRLSEAFPYLESLLELN